MEEIKRVFEEMTGNFRRDFRKEEYVYFCLNKRMK